MDDLISVFKIAFCDFGDKFGDMDTDRTSADARMIFAIQAAFCFIYGLFSGIAEGDLPKVFIAHIRLLGGHRILFQGHIRHGKVPSFYDLSTIYGFTRRPAAALLGGASEEAL